MVFLQKMVLVQKMCLVMGNGLVPRMELELMMALTDHNCICIS